MRSLSQAHTARCTKAFELVGRTLQQVSLKINEQQDEQKLAKHAHSSMAHTFLEGNALAKDFYYFINFLLVHHEVYH